MILPGTVFQDLRYGARVLRGNLRFTVVAVLALALGIGVNTAVFTAYKAMVTRSLDARDPGELVNLALIRNSGVADFAFSYPDYEAYRDSAHSFSGMIAFSPEHMTLRDPGIAASQRDSALYSVFVVSENYFKVLGITALRGRTLESIPPAELVASPSVLISENFWQRHFAGDPAVLGETIRLNGVSVTVVGITPGDFVGTGIAVPDFWLPLSLEPLVYGDDNWLRDRENRRCRLFARRVAGVRINQAQAEMTLLSGRLRSLHDPHSESAKPVTSIVWPGSPFPLPVQFYGGLKLTILLIMGAAAMLLAVACANVGSLQLARARSRQNELRTRLSLGASRRRVIRQLLTESTLLSLMAGFLALLFTWALLEMAVKFAAEALPPEYGSLIFHVTPDLGIFAYVLLISSVTGILFGLAPALESSRAALSLATRSSTSPVRSRKIQDFLIAAQVALSLVLLIAGGMLIHSSIRPLKMDTGYNSKRVVDLELRFPEGLRYNAAREGALVRELRTRLAALPGVTAITNARPPADDTFRTTAVPIEGGKSDQNAGALLYYTYVQANYFQALGVPLIMGQAFQRIAGQPEHEVIVSESAAKRLWPGENPVGRGLRLGVTDERFHNSSELLSDGEAADGAVYRIIGVARDTRGVEFDGSDSERAYLPLPDDRLGDRPMLIRTQSDPAEVIGAIDPVIYSIDPDLVATASTLEEGLRRSPPFIAASLSAAVASTLGILGLLLASMGIYGTVSYVVLFRTREVGIRMAIGAQKRDILGLILREGTRPVLAGLLVGMLLAVGASNLLRSVLYGLDAADAISFMGVSLLFLTIALCAAYLPARRAVRIDPAVALRYE